MDARIAEHQAEPRDDLTSFLIDAELDGQKLSPEHVRGTMILLMIAGIDTTWSAIGASLWHLASHPDDRHRLASDPALMDTAVEEFLRAYAPVTMARLVAKDVELDGRSLHEGDWLLLPFPGRQPRSGGLPGCQRGAAGPGRQPPRRLRAGHPSLSRLQPGPHGAAGGSGGVDRPIPRVRAGGPGRGDLVEWPGARPSPYPGADHTAPLILVDWPPGSIPASRPHLAGAARGRDVRSRARRPYPPRSGPA